MLSFLSFKSFKTDINIKVEQADKYVHFLMYFIFTLLLLVELGNYQLKIKLFWVYLTLLAMFLSGVIEIMQEFLTDYRSGDWFDFLSNAFGCSCGLFVFVIAKKMF